MDKEGGESVERPNKEKTITIKINGKNRAYIETKSQNNNSETKRFTKEQAYNNKKKIDYYSEIQAAATKEAEEEDEFDWILPEEDPEPYMIKEYKMANQSSNKKTNGFGTIRSKLKHNRSPIFSKPLIMVALFAILVGTSFGLIILNLVKTEKVIETAEPVIAKPQQNGEEGSSIETLNLEPLEIYVIQGGVFSNPDAAKQLQAEHLQKRVPAQILERDGQAFLYLGVADNIEHAKKMGSQLAEKGVEVFAKSISLDAKTINSLQSDEKRILEVVHTFYEILTTGASEGAVSGTIPDALFESAEKQATVLKAIDREQIKNEQILIIKTELENATSQLNDYKKQPTPEALEKVQQHLLNFLVAYTAL